MKPVSTKRLSRVLCGVALAGAFCAASMPAMAAHQTSHAGSARSYAGATTDKQRTVTLKKEINAAYAEQERDCKKQSASQRSACLKSARQIYRQDMAKVPRLVANPPVAEVIERVVAVTPATPANTATAGNAGAPAAGTTAYGSSGAGSTASGSDSGSSGSSGSNAGTPGSPSDNMMPATGTPLQPSQSPAQGPSPAPAQQQ